ncbi:MAG: hypothetical protein Q9171_001782 [Xanthocarpia ochracea]
MASSAQTGFLNPTSASSVETIAGLFEDSIQNHPEWGGRRSSLNAPGGVVPSVGGELVVTAFESWHRFRDVNNPTLEYFDPFGYLEEPLGQQANLLLLTSEPVHPSDPAVVLSTSGSTGQPNGVMLSHRTLIEPVRLLSRMENIDPSSRVLQFARNAVAGLCEASSIIATVLHPESEPSILGKASSRASIHVLDDFGGPVAVGIEGEIYASGYSIALAYLNNETNTSTSFCLAASLDAQLDLEGDVLYATADYGELTEAGEFIFHGRRDSEANISGQRVDLNTIRQMKMYGFVSRKRSYSRLITAPVDDPALVRELYSACRALLQSYMIPKFVVVLAIPLNPSGKVDEQGLSKIAEASFRSDPDGMTHPVSKIISKTRDLDGMLATIVASRFFGDKPSVMDNLKHYGPTSIDFMRFLKDVQNTLCIALSLGQVLKDLSSRQVKACSFESILWSTQRTYDACMANTLPSETVAKALHDDGMKPREVRPEVMLVYHDSDQTSWASKSSSSFLQSAERMQLTHTGSRFDLAIHYSKI